MSIAERIATASASKVAGKYAETEALCRELLSEDTSDEEKAQIYLLLSESLWRRGNVEEGLENAHQAIELAATVADKSLYALACRCMGSAQWMRLHYDEAQSYYEKAFEIYSEINDADGIATSLGNLGLVFKSKNDFPKALEYYQKASALHQEIGNKAAFAGHQRNLGAVYFDIADYGRALECFQEALKIYEDLGQEDAKALLLSNMGVILLQIDEHQRALQNFQEALPIYKKVGNKVGISSTLGNIGIVLFALRNLDEALEVQCEALAINEEIGRTFGVATDISNIGDIYFQIGEFEQAIGYYKRALTLNQELELKDRAAINIYNMGNVYSQITFKEYNPLLAEELLLQAIDLFEEIGAKKEIYGVFYSLASLYEQEKRWEEHSRYLKKHYITKEEVQNEETKKSAQKISLERQIDLMEREQSVTDALLLKTFPASIVPRMKAGEKVLMEEFDSASVLFADLEGFTTMATVMSPLDLVNLLNTIFTHFDAIINNCGCERLRTLGDGYLAMSGVPDRCHDHAYRLAKAAMEMVNGVPLPPEISSKIPESTTIKMRIGLHCGRLVAGIVGGLDKWQYDIYGDTVNTASRMESHGVPGKVHISQPFKEAIEQYEEFAFEERGSIIVKGKGEMKTYFLSLKTI